MGPRDRPHLTLQRLPPPFAATPHRRTTSGAPCWPSPRASTSSTDRGRRTRHRHQRIDDVSPERIRQDWAVSRGSTPPPITRPPPTAQCRGKGGPQAHPAGTRSALPAAGAVGGSCGCGGGCCRQGSVRGDGCGGPSPHTVRRWSAKRPEMAAAARQQPTVKSLVRTGFQLQPTLPNHPSFDFARRGLGVRFPSSPLLQHLVRPAILDGRRVLGTPADRLGPQEVPQVAACSVSNRSATSSRSSSNRSA